MNFAMHGYMETLITYILAVASPTHPVPASLYHDGWACCNYKNTRTFYGITMDVGHDYGGPLFWEHYSFLGFDPRNKKDAYTNYFRNSTAICLINHEFCIDNPYQYAGCSDKCWGLSAAWDLQATMLLNRLMIMAPLPHLLQLHPMYTRLIITSMR